MAKNSITEVAKEIAAKHGLSQKDAEFFVTSFFEQIYDGLRIDDVVKVKGLGTFKVIEVRNRESVNVNTGERVVIEGHNKITFVPDAIMRDFINKPFAQFETVVINEGVDIEELNNVHDVDFVSDSEYEETLDLSSTNSDIEDNDSDNIEEAQENDLDANKIEESIDNEDNVDKDINQEVTVNSQKEKPEIFSHAIKEEEQVSLNEEQRCIEEHTEEATSTVAENNICIENKENPLNNNVCFFNRNKWFFVFLLIFICIISLLGGYYVGLHHKTATEVKYAVDLKSEKKEKSSVCKNNLKDSVNSDTVSKELAENLDIISEEDVSDVSSIDREETDKGKESKKIDDSFTLSTAKNIVRTGAYRIVGTDKTITIKKGESLKKISKFYLGDGMDCYIQVHNNIVEVKEGQKLRIPKLELKKKRIK